MLHPEIKKLVQEMFAYFDEEEGERAREYPEVYLLSLLEGIKKDLPEVSATLDLTVEMAGFGSDTERFQKILARIQPTKPLSRRLKKMPIKKRPMKLAA